ncbi:DUF4064 domain-containing protein [Staphylococcus muscae]|uniref:Membrane protein n=1 Tax=Staphylococcus muscae TaxID=1294 RepID=A0A240C0K2_9STAP|nr:DUF4064 domain-containing protein [Staphylococcus muscae]AVQ32731.1 DUF4064 domain-containing protein [Staphylococcus muscae]PNZ05355.1 DUF4064 domain-containing protein [Staphylococcus muscae]GGA81596.1 hypothetical protein GCM10007183_02240 [Staphylococcus muscae]SNW01460.1 membrane protein [Staphylococcus muscae]
MTGEVYTQIRRPVNRLAEKILGWLSWLLILGATVIAMFFGLVLFSNENSIQSLEYELANNPTVQEILANYNLTTTELVIQLQNGVWAFIVYLIVCLLISFLALISMNHRILSGILFLLVSFITLPLIVMLVPIFFFIVALMMFGRKERIESVPMYDAYEFEPQRPVYAEPQRDPVPPQREREYHNMHDDVTEQPEDVSIMSRTAKYHHKQSDATSSPEDDAHLDDTIVEDMQTVDASDKEINESSQSNGAPYTYQSFEDTVPLTKEELKQQKKEEKAQLKAERKAARKAKKAYAKEQRQNRPSASSQRRQNYEDRMKKQQERTEQDGANKE